MTLTASSTINRLTSPWPPVSSTTGFRTAIQNSDSVILLAISAEGQTIGFCQLYPTFCSVEAKPIYSLYDLFVTPAARRSGAGKALLQAAEALAATHGKSRLDLTTAKTNQPSQAAYEALGWVRDEVLYAYSRRVGEKRGRICPAALRN